MGLVAMIQTALTVSLARASKSSTAVSPGLAEMVGTPQKRATSAR